MVTGDMFALVQFRDIPNQNAFRARMRTRGIAEIQTGERVLEERGGFMWRTNGAAVSAVLDEGQLEFQLLQEFAILVGH
jgi:hypothetical protein